MLEERNGFTTVGALQHVTGVTFFVVRICILILRVLATKTTACLETQTKHFIIQKPLKFFHLNFTQVFMTKVTRRKYKLIKFEK